MVSKQKLVLMKETISTLSNYELGQIQGGNFSDILNTYTYTVPPPPPDKTSCPCCSCPKPKD